jgi:F-type H+-transporting ATPase subunit epsilon
VQFELLTLTGSKFSGEIAEVHLTTASGQIGILPHHEALTAIVKPGAVTVRVKGGGEEVFATFGGLLEITSDNHVRVLADEAERADDLVQSEIEAALAHAKQLLAAATDKHELASAQELVDRQAVRLEVAGLRRRHHNPKPIDRLPHN